MEYADPAKAVETYYKLKKEYGQTPSFYVDVADYFFKKGDTQQAILVVSNLAELSLEDAQLLRVLAYKLSAYKAYPEAVSISRKVVAIREEEPNLIAIGIGLSPSRGIPAGDRDPLQSSGTSLGSALQRCTANRHERD